MLYARICYIHNLIASKIRVPEDGHTDWSPMSVRVCARSRVSSMYRICVYNNILLILHFCKLEDKVFRILSVMYYFFISYIILYSTDNAGDLCGHLMRNKVQNVSRLYCHCSLFWLSFLYPIPIVPQDDLLI